MRKERKVRGHKEGDNSITLHANELPASARRRKSGLGEQPGRDASQLDGVHRTKLLPFAPGPRSENLLGRSRRGSKGACRMLRRINGGNSEGRRRGLMLPLRFRRTYGGRWGNAYKRISITTAYSFFSSSIGQYHPAEKGGREDRPTDRGERTNT